MRKRDWITWLKKLKSVREIVARYKTSWYNEGKIQGQIEGLSKEEEYQQGWHDALEKQVASSIMNFLDKNTLGMCLSSMECKDLEDAVVDSDWAKVYDYMKKKLEKQGGQNSTWSEDDENIISDAEAWLDTLCDYLKDSSSEYISNIRVIISKLKSLKQRLKEKYER